MNARTKTFLLLGVTLLPVVFWSILLLDVFLESDRFVPWFVAAISLRGVVGLFWLIHMLRNREITQVHKVLWAIGLCLEAFGSLCFGSFGIIELVYWFYHVYQPYQVDRMYQAMRDE